MAETKSSTITVETIGRRHYLRGNTYPIKDKIRAAGCKWDPDEKAWYSGDRSKVDGLTASLAPMQPTPESSMSGASESAAPGDDATVAARATYQGKTYYVLGRASRERSPGGYGMYAYRQCVEMISTRDGQKYLLAFRDGSKSFWAVASEVSIAKQYERPTTIRKLREFAEQRKKEDRGEAECPLCKRNCTCGTSQFCQHHHDGCDRCGEER